MEYYQIVDLLGSTQYMEATAEEKRDTLWQLISREPYLKLPPMKLSMHDSALAILNKPWLRKAFTFEHREDVRLDRFKAFHPFDSVAMVTYIPERGHDYTGFFETGGVGLARLSLAMDESHYAPSAAFELMYDGSVDGHTSQNVMLDMSLDQHDTRDFFERPPTNITNWPRKWPMVSIWPVVHVWLGFIAPPLHEPLDHRASHGRDGTRVDPDRGKAPWQVFFRVPPSVHFDPRTIKDFREELEEIPTGTLLYDVFAISTASDKNEQKIATVVTDSHFVTSRFQDRVLALQCTRNAAGGFRRMISLSIVLVVVGILMGLRSVIQGTSKPHSDWQGTAKPTTRAFHRASSRQQLSTTISVSRFALPCGGSRF